MKHYTDICKETREIASDALHTTLQNIKDISSISEKQLADTWLVELQKNPSLFPEGWYMPPPHGIGVLFGVPKRDGRQNYITLRDEKMWPRSDVFLDGQNHIGYLFASPVDTTGIIGDFGLTVYVGKDQKVKDHLKRCMEITRTIFDYIEIGKPFSDVYSFAENLFRKKGLVNGVTSKTDPTGHDLGHTIPGTYPIWADDEKQLFDDANSNWTTLKDMISTKRIFVNKIEQTTYQPGMAITIEPRLTIEDDERVPMGTFHTIVLIHPDGKKELVTQFDKIFDFFSMDYLI